MHPTAVSLFSGVGGFDLGARIAGAHVVLATDVDESALTELRATQGTETLCGDLHELLRSGELQSRVPDRPTLVIGGPPCTAFSHAGFWLDNKRNGQDPAADLLGVFVDAVRALGPDAFVLENVPGLRFKTHARFFTSLLNRTRAAGYSVTHAVLNGAEFGVPQARRRLFVVGVRGGPQLPLQQITTAYPNRSAGWALDALDDDKNPAEPDEVPQGTHSRWLEHIPPGENYIHLTERGDHVESPFQYRSRYWSFLLKIHPDQPAPTIPAQRVTYNGPFHWSGRHLRVRELARLQMFPDHQTLSEDLSTARRHIGNAVPPLLAAAVVHEVLRVLGFADINQRPITLTTAARPEATVQDIASTYPRRN